MSVGDTRTDLHQDSGFPVRAPTFALKPRFGASIPTDIFVVFELALIVAAGFVMKMLYVGMVLGSDEPFSKYAFPFALILPITFYVFRVHGLYAFPLVHRWPQSAGRAARALAIAFLLLIAAGFLFRVANDYSRAWLLLWFVTSYGLVLLTRTAAAPIFGILANRGTIRTRVAILGSGEVAEETVEHLRALNPYIEIAGTFAVDTGHPDQCDLETDSIDQLVKFAQENPLDQVILALSPHSQLSVSELLEALSVLPVEVKLVPPQLAFSVPVRGVEQLGHLTLLDLRRKPISNWGIVLKSVEDYVAGALALIVFAPIMALIALAIRLESSGPALFVQRRHGYNHQVIRVWKFRTMHVADDGDTIVQASKGDQRITRVGYWLRRTSLDELPQLFNVLRGEMSLVGPRPHALAHTRQYSETVERYANRHRVKPGITGWAQIHGLRGPTNDPEKMRARVMLDLQYIENWSLWLDLKILLATPFVGFLNKNAI